MGNEVGWVCRTLGRGENSVQSLGVNAEIKETTGKPEA
jgi:hypothetical protein